MATKRHIGFTCAYTPVQLIHAAGFTPYRILPMGNSPNQAGTVLHDNMCPHVKQVLDAYASLSLYIHMYTYIYMHVCSISLYKHVCI